MSLKGKAYIVGAYEHPTRKAPDTSLAQLHAEVAKGALDDAGLRKSDVDGYFCASGDTPGLGGLSMIEYMGLKLHIDATDTGALLQRMSAMRCRRSRPGAAMSRSSRSRTAALEGDRHCRAWAIQQPDAVRVPYGPATASMYAMAARRHMHEFGTTSEQLAWVKVAASHRTQQSMPAAESGDSGGGRELPIVADPLHRLDCCVISDGGGAW
jgi:acetyl-CoA C-acetyltransferase